MDRIINRKSIISLIVALMLVATFAGSVLLPDATAPTRAFNPGKGKSSNAFCSRIGHGIEASSGARMYCFGPKTSSSSAKNISENTSSLNFDAANPREDITPNGTRVYGQTDTSIAGNATYAVEAWNDATGFFAPCGSPMNKEELTGLGFSNNGGRSFKDLGGLPNNCQSGFIYFGDPTVETWQSGGTTYFYIGSLYLNVINGQSDVAMDACKVNGTGSSATLSCSLPIIVAAGIAPVGPKGDFLDKDFFSIDPQRGRLYMSYTRFGLFSVSPYFEGQIDLSVCDLQANPAQPVCYPGNSTTPYFIVRSGQRCENEGAYPAVDIQSGDVYVAWEYNWVSNVQGGAPCNTIEHVKNKIAYVPFSCLTLTSTSLCKTMPHTTSVNVVSMDLAFIPGYSGVPFQGGNTSPSDFPRIAVSDPYGTVTIVWNDTRYHGLGDILLESFNLVSLSRVQSRPVRINPDTGGMHFMPSLRQAQASGLIDVSYYQRRSANTDSTNVDALLNLNPRTAGPGVRTRVTNEPSAWSDTSSDASPNFGDYTDNYVQAASQPPYYNNALYVAWTDGRLGYPQPFATYGIS